MTGNKRESRTARQELSTLFSQLLTLWFRAKPVMVLSRKPFQELVGSDHSGCRHWHWSTSWSQSSVTRCPSTFLNQVSYTRSTPPVVVVIVVITTTIFPIKNQQPRLDSVQWHCDQSITVLWTRRFSCS